MVQVLLDFVDFVTRKRRSKPGSQIFNGHDPLDWLPNELITEVFSWLSVVELAQCKAVSRTWRAILSGTPIWPRTCSISFDTMVRGRYIIRAGSFEIPNLSLQQAMTYIACLSSNISTCDIVVEPQLGKYDSHDDELFAKVLANYRMHRLERFTLEVGCMRASHLILLFKMMPRLRHLEVSAELRFNIYTPKVDKTTTLRLESLKLVTNRTEDIARLDKLLWSILCRAPKLTGLSVLTREMLPATGRSVGAISRLKGLWDLTLAVDPLPELMYGGNQMRLFCRRGLEPSRAKNPVVLTGVKCLEIFGSADSALAAIDFYGVGETLEYLLVQAPQEMKIGPRELTTLCMAAPNVRKLVVPTTTMSARTVGSIVGRQCPFVEEICFHFDFFFDRETRSFLEVGNIKRLKKENGTFVEENVYLADPHMTEIRGYELTTKS
jgi:hypothetical protein